MSENEIVRCGWAGTDPLYISYHDNEWGVPVHDDRHFFEMLILEGAQAGLSWITVLRRREGYRAAFDNFDVAKVAAYDATKTAALKQDARIVRNEAKIRAAVQNANAFLKVQAEFGSFDKYIWRFVDGQPQLNQPATLKDIPAETETSQKMSKDLRRRGFGFVGPTICYAFMQACGLVDDHVLTCYKRRVG